MDLTERSLNPAEIKRLTDEEIGRLKQQPQFTSLFLDDVRRACAPPRPRALPLPLT